MKFSLQNLADQELSYQAIEHQMERFQMITDLDVNISQNFSWDFHIDVIFTKCLQKLAHIRQVSPDEN